MKNNKTTISKDLAIEENYDKRRLMVRNTYKQTLKDLQPQLQKPKRRAAQVIHHPFVDTLGAFLIQTLGRPIGLLFGGVLACIFTYCIWFLAQQYGFPYPNSTFIIGYTLGYITGLLAELLLKLIRH